MKQRQELVDYALAHGWDDDALKDLHKALNTGLEEALTVLGERHCPAIEYCEMVALLLEWYRADLPTLRT